MKHLVLLLLLIPCLALAQTKSDHTSIYQNIAVLALTGLVAVLVFVNHRQARRQKETYTQQLEDAYRAALQGTDKVKAFELGYAYYRTLCKDGEPTAADQQALLSDLSRMTIFSGEQAKGELSV
jgi:hypothetical protein